MTDFLISSEMLYLRNRKFVKLSDLTNKLVGWLLESDVDGVKPSMKKHIRRKLAQEFGDCLHFVADDNGKILLYPERKPEAKR